MARGYGVKGLRRRTSTWLRWRLPAWFLPGCCFHSFNWRKEGSVASFEALRQTAWLTQSFLGGVEAKPGKNDCDVYIQFCATNRFWIAVTLSFELKHFGLMDVFIAGVSLNLLMPRTPKYGKGSIGLSIHPSIKKNKRIIIYASKISPSKIINWLLFCQSASKLLKYHLENIYLLWTWKHIWDQLNIFKLLFKRLGLVISFNVFKVSYAH